MGQVDVEVRRVEGLEFRVHAEGLLQAGVVFSVFDGQQEDRAGVGQEQAQLGHVAGADGLRQGGEGGAVVDAVDLPEVGLGQGEVVAAEDGEAAVLPEGEAALPALDRLQAVLAEECLDRDGAQLDANHLMALLDQPEHVQALAAQRHEYPAAPGQLEAGPEAAEQGVDRLLVEGGSAFAPEPQPELVIAVGHAATGSARATCPRVAGNGAGRRGPTPIRACACGCSGFARGRRSAAGSCRAGARPWPGPSRPARGRRSPVRGRPGRRRPG